MAVGFPTGLSVSAVFFHSLCEKMFSCRFFVTSSYLKDSEPADSNRPLELKLFLGVVAVQNSYCFVMTVQSKQLLFCKGLENNIYPVNNHAYDTQNTLMSWNNYGDLLKHVFIISVSVKKLYKHVAQDNEMNDITGLFRLFLYSSYQNVSECLHIALNQHTGHTNIIPISLGSTHPPQPGQHSPASVRLPICTVDSLSNPFSDHVGASRYSSASRDSR